MKKQESYHFIGLGGIGMSALARILLQRGDIVQGSDASESPLLKQLEKEGAQVRVGHQEGDISAQTTVVYSTDIKENNVEYAAAKKRGVSMIHRAELLDRLMQGKKALLVTGTHGKTTTSALLASVFMEAEWDPSFALGGILLSTESNSRFGKGEYFIAEADESDGSFLKTASFGAIVTNLENDHLDYWKSEKKLDEAFEKFFSQVKQAKHLFWCRDSERLLELNPEGISYGFSEGSQIRLRNFRATEKGALFDISYEGNHYDSIAISLYGKHNALNAAAVFGLCLSLGISETIIREALENFSGTYRRLEFKGEAHRLQVFDDYAHHPTKIDVTLKALRDKIRERRLVAVFQPHRFSRVRDLFDDFSHCFDEADLVIMTDIYGAREAPIEGISTESLFDHLKKDLGEKIVYIPKGSLVEETTSILQPFDVVVTLGAGDITYTGAEILESFSKRAPKIKVAVLAGGTSKEHEVSLSSGKTIQNELDPSIYEVSVFGISKEGHWIFGEKSFDLLESKNLETVPSPCLSSDILKKLNECDVCIPAFHGSEGEDGMMQGFFDVLQIPFIGCDSYSGSICMNKSWTKQIATFHNIPTAPFVEIDATSFKKDPRKLIKQIDERKIRYPLYIKPVHLGSSIGVTRATTAQEAIEGARAAFELDDWIIAEQEILGRELEVSLLGNEYIRIAPPAMVMNKGIGPYTYEQKYGNQPLEKKVPAPITPIENEVLCELALRTYRALSCKGLARIDFFLDQNGHFWLNEVNPFPGFTFASGYPKMWRAAGVSLSQLCDEFIALALHRDRSVARRRRP